jgi:glycosyltransferase involved in cell wall biosynthesis
MKKINELSVFFPTYNEAAVLEQVIKKAIAVLKNVADKWEIIIVDDGSVDNTKSVVKKLISDDKRIRSITHSGNRGYGAAFKSGFYGARYNWIAFTDSDGQFDFSEITDFIEKQRDTKADLVIGYYRKRRVALTKIITSRVWEFFVNMLFGLRVHDIDCGFKFVSKKVIDTIPILESERGAFISSEFLIKAKKAGFKIAEIPVTHLPRKTGSGTGRNLKVIINSFLDLLRLWKKLR